VCCSHDLCIVYSWLHHPECPDRHWVELCKLTFMGWADPPLDHPNRFPFMQVGLYFLEIHNTDRFCAFWRVFCEYFTLDLHFSTNLSRENNGIRTTTRLLNSGSSTCLYGMRLTAVELGKFDLPLWHVPYGCIMYNGADRGQPVDSHMIICHTSVTCERHSYVCIYTTLGV